MANNPRCNVAAVPVDRLAEGPPQHRVGPALSTHDAHGQLYTVSAGAGIDLPSNRERTPSPGYGTRPMARFRARAESSLLRVSAGESEPTFDTASSTNLRADLSHAHAHTRARARAQRTTNHSHTRHPNVREHA